MGRQWSILTTQLGINETFEEYINIDEDISIAGQLTDAEIINSVQLLSEEEEDDENDCIYHESPISETEVKKSVEVIRSFFERSTGVTEDIFSAVNYIDNAIDKELIKSLKQTKITEFFKKV